MPKADESRKRAQFGCFGRDMVLQRFTDDVRGRTSLATSDSLEFSQKSGVEED
jgi:hypothetical protein